MRHAPSKSGRGAIEGCHAGRGAGRRPYAGRDASPKSPPLAPTSLVGRRASRPGTVRWVCSTRDDLSFVSTSTLGALSGAHSHAWRHPVASA
jgi:hypothetical protein